jgi:NitT/TauT family transport system substrate-binding protein
MKKRWLTTATAAGLALALAASACGDGGDEDGAAAPADPAADGGAPAGECETIDEVSVQLQWVTQAQFAGYYAAVDRGYYEEFCLEVTIVEGGVDIVPQQQLASGLTDFAVSWVPKALVSREEGLNIVNVAQIFERSGTLQVAFADSGITSVEDFAGKRIGNWGFGNEFELLAGARKAGLEPGVDFELVQQSFDMLALIAGDIDAAQAMIYNEYAQVLETVNPETGELFQPEDLVVIDWNEEGTAMLQDAIWADGQRLADDAAYRDLTTRFIAGTLKGWVYCRDNLEACADIVLAASPILGQSHQMWMMNEINALIWPASGRAGVMQQDLWDQTVEVATSEGVLAGPPDEGAFTTEYAEAAVALLEAQGLDLQGSGFTRSEVELREGGE